MIKSCSVSGHRKIPFHLTEVVRQALHQEILLAVTDGYTNFISGFAEGVDYEFADTVASLKREFLSITLEAAIPHRGRMRTKDVRFHTLIDQCEYINIQSETHYAGVYHARNRSMVERAERLIAVYDGRAAGGTVYTMNYAMLLGREVSVIRMDKM